LPTTSALWPARLQKPDIAGVGGVFQLSFVLAHRATGRGSQLSALDPQFGRGPIAIRIAKLVD
jgi:hypothetical protein